MEFRFKSLDRTRLRRHTPHNADYKLIVYFLARLQVAKKRENLILCVCADSAGVKYNKVSGGIIILKSEAKLGEDASDTLTVSFILLTSKGKNTSRARLNTIHIFDISASTTVDNRRIRTNAHESPFSVCQYYIS